MFPLKLSEKMFFISFFWWTDNNNQPHLSFIAKKTQKAINWVFEMKKNLRLKRFFYCKVNNKIVSTTILLIKISSIPTHYN